MIELGLPRGTRDLNDEIIVEQGITFFHAVEFIFIRVELWN
jgi:hypothetical protein